MSIKDPAMTIRPRRTLQTTANDRATPVVCQRPCHDHKAVPDHKAVATANDEAAPDHKAAATTNDEAAPVVY